ESVAIGGETLIIRMSTTLSNTNFFNGFYGSWRWGCLKLFENIGHGGSHDTCLLIDCMSKFGYLEGRRRINITGFYLRNNRFVLGITDIGFVFDNRQHILGDLCIDPMPHETIHQTVDESWKFHYGDLSFLRGKEFIDEFGNKIFPSENKTRGFFFEPTTGCPYERERKKHKFNCRTGHIFVFDCGSYFVEPTDVIMRIVFFESEELVRSHHVNETMLELKMLSKNWWDHNCLCITLGCFERLRLRRFGFEEVGLGEDSPTRFEEERVRMSIRMDDVRVKDELKEYNGPRHEIEIQNKVTKLFSLLDEVDRKYRKYCQQLQIVEATLDVVYGCGVTRPYTKLAHLTISRYF
nr:BEL1-like homeodomain protein 3 [Tanacetum cinerariifolium]